VGADQCRSEIVLPALTFRLDEDLKICGQVMGGRGGLLWRLSPPPPMSREGPVALAAGGIGA
jgi:hypothetical protein